MAYPLIIELEARHALGCLSPHKGAGPDKLCHKVHKALSFHTARMFNLFFQTSQISGELCNSYPSRKTPRTTGLRLFRPISLTSVVSKILEAILKEMLLPQLSQLSKLV